MHNCFNFQTLGRSCTYDSVNDMYVFNLDHCILRIYHCPFCGVNFQREQSEQDEKQAKHERDKLEHYHECGGCGSRYYMGQGNACYKKECKDKASDRWCEKCLTPDYS